MAKKELLAKVLVKSGLVHAAAAAHHWRFRDIKVLAYHRVLPRTPEAGFPFDLELVSAWEEEFDWQMAYLSRHFQVVNSMGLLEMLDAGRWPSKPLAMVTFDDGFRDNHDVVLPILQRHGLTATVFISTAYVASGDDFWFDQLVHDILQTRLRALPMDDAGAVCELGDTEAQRREAAARLLNVLKRLPNAERVARSAQWRSLMAVQPIEGLDYTLHGPMSWSHVRAMADAGIEIGSHTVTHPVLPRVETREGLREELLQSRLTLEQQIGRPVVSLAYPTGGPGAYSDEVVNMARETGYRLAYTYRGGINGQANWAPHLIRRMAVERYVSRERFVARLALPDLL
jgi:peptidoglycan/xylan/chitin deacetylase (PgdA/CDA1 family)